MEEDIGKGFQNSLKSEIPLFANLIDSGFSEAQIQDKKVVGDIQLNVGLDIQLLSINNGI